MMKGNKIQIAYKHSKSLVYRRQAKLPEQKPQIVFFGRNSFAIRPVVFTTKALNKKCFYNILSNYDIYVQVILNVLIKFSPKRNNPTM